MLLSVEEEVDVMEAQLVLVGNLLSVLHLCSPNYSLTLFATSASCTERVYPSGSFD